MKFQLLVVLAGLCLLISPARAQSGLPSIASLSNSQTITEGQNVTLTVSVNGTSPFSYQWRKAGTAISGATSSSLAFTPIRAADAGSYTVTVTNSVGAVTSGPVVLAVNAAVAPTFYYQPSAVSFVVGDTLNLSASVSGTAPLTFEWKRGSTTVATTTSGYYSKANVQSTDAGTYTVTASNIAGSVTSSPFVVTVNPVTAPSFGYGLSDVTVATGGSINFYPSVSGSGTVTYQWKKDGVAISGATSYYFSKYNVQAADAGNYTLTATNSAGSTTSNAAKVTVLPPVVPTISSVSSPVSVVVGDSFYLSVYAGGTEPLSFQWRKDGVNISGATSSYYSKSNAQTSDAGAYSVVVSNAQGSVTSGTIAVSIASARPPIITYHPASFAVRIGSYISSLSVGVSGTGPLSYQWSKNGVAITGATSSSLYFGGAAQASDAGTYTVVVSSAQGSATSEPCYVVILPATAPQISAQPASQTVRQGAGLSLYANVTGTPSPTIQWRKDGVNIAGASGSSYYKSNVASSDAGAYSFVATNSAGTATSDNATITVLAVGAPRIISHPASASLLPGDSFYGMFVDVRSDSTASVQWYRDGVLLPGQTGSYFYISNAQPSMAGVYTAVVTNSAGSVTSRQGVITVDANTTRPAITYVQGSRSIFGGTSVSLNVSTSSSGETVQWFKDGVAIPNATLKEYAFSNFGPTSVGTYTLQVATTAGTFTSQPIVLELLDAGMAPLITTQPVSQTVLPGGYSSGFYVNAEGEGPLAYQWKKDGVVISGATSNSYSIYDPKAANAGSYSVVVTNRNGTATSAAAVLTVNTTPTAAPIITAHPASATITTGSGSISFYVYVLDSTGVTYQWRKNGTPIASATGYSYYVSATAAAAGRYSVVVTNSVGSATSYDAVLAVTSAATGPTFTEQPKSAEGFYGNTITFTSAATGTAPVTYQWRKNGSAIAGATGSSLTLTNVQNVDAATYTVIATDVNGSTPSAAVTLTLSGGTPPFIITHPANVTALAGTSATFSASVGGTPAPTVQWQRDGVDLPGATNLSLNLSAVVAGDAGKYTLQAKSAAGVATSNPAILTVVFPPPTIITQPSNVSVQPGGSAAFSVTVNSVPPPTYQWRKDGVSIAGGTGSTLSLSNVQSANGGRYSVVVTTSFGSVTSLEALLTVGNPVTASVPRTMVATVGSNVTIPATVQSVDPLVFSWAKQGVVIPGATTTSLTLSAVQLGDGGTYSFGISRPDGTVLYPLTGPAALTTLLTVEPKLLPTILEHPVGATVPIGATVTLRVRAQDAGPITYQWQKNGVPIPDAFRDTLVLTNVQLSDTGDYRAVVIGANGSTASSIARIEVTGSAFAGTYSGVFPNGDIWVMQVGVDGVATFLAILSERGQAIVARNVVVQSSGAFSFGLPVSAAAAGAAPFTGRYFNGVVQGQITGGATVSGNIPGASLPLLGARVTSPTASANVGHAQAVPLASEMGQIDAIGAPDGTVFLVAVDASGVRGGRGNLDAAGGFTISQPTYTYRGTLAADQGRLLGTFQPANGAVVSFTTVSPVAGPERLVNVATRGLAGSGNRTLTAGFVISGTGAKEVLIRAVGPGLTGFGVTGTLPNPRLRIFRDGAAIIENDDWMLGGFSTQIADAAVKVGAFSLAPGSADAAILARLEPGAYTAQIGADGDALGVALVEVYDTATPVAGAPKLVNLSTRGEVGRGGDILIVGVVVSGNAAKRLLIRGIGPGLTGFGVNGALADPKLQLFQGSSLLRENDNWSDTADAAALATTAAAVGAFELSTNSKDAALLLYLAPGSYTAQVSGVNANTGVALVEVYEVP